MVKKLFSGQYQRQKMFAVWFGVVPSSSWFWWRPTVISTSFWALEAVWRSLSAFRYHDNFKLFKVYTFERISGRIPSCCEFEPIEAFCDASKSLQNFEALNIRRVGASQLRDQKLKFERDWWKVLLKTLRNFVKILVGKITSFTRNRACNETPPHRPDEPLIQQPRNLAHI